MRNLLVLVAALSASATQAQERAIKVECEIETLVAESIGGHEPLDKVYFYVIRYTANPADKTVLIQRQDVPNAPAVIRTARILTDDLLVMCQTDGEQCQQDIAEPGSSWRSRMSLTQIDLAAGRYSRRQDRTVTGPTPNQDVIQAITQTGDCRKV